MNKAKSLRKALGWTPTECGVRLFGFSRRTAYDRWMQWESGTRQMSAPTARYFDLLLFLVLCRDLKTPGAEQALSRFLEITSDDL